jgi:hypothetical protein
MFKISTRLRPLEKIRRSFGWTRRLGRYYRCTDRPLMSAESRSDTIQRSLDHREERGLYGAGGKLLRPQLSRWRF